MDDHQYLQDQRHRHAFPMVTSGRLLSKPLHSLFIVSEGHINILVCINSVQLKQSAANTLCTPWFHWFQISFFGSMLLECAKNCFLPIPQAGLAAVEIPI